MKHTDEEIEAYYEALLKEFKKDPNFELQQEFGEMLMRHIDTFTPKELERYNELKQLLK